MILQRLRTALDRKLKKFLDEDYRDGYLSTHVRAGIGLQIRALREKGDLSQEQFALLTGKKQSTISRLEDTNYGRVSVQTLLDIASATGVALLVRFVDYPQFLRITSDMSERALAPENILESEARVQREEQAAILKAFDEWFAPEQRQDVQQLDAPDMPNVLDQWQRKIAGANQQGSKAISWN